MVSRETSEQIFRKLREDPINNVCFDCNSRNPDWASVSNGVFLCLNCAGIHRGFGVHISFVRSLSMDTWSIKQLKIMTVGGNKALTDFFQSYDIPLALPVHINKFKTRAAQYYRDRIKVAAEGVNYEVPAPDREVGQLSIEEEERKVPEPLPQQSQQSQAFSWSGAFGSAYEATKSIGIRVAEKAKEVSQKPIVQEWEEKTKNAFSAAVVKTKEWSQTPAVQNFKDKTINGIQQVAQSETVQKMKDKTKSALSSIAGKAKETYDSIHNKPPEEANGNYQPMHDQ